MSVTDEEIQANSPLGEEGNLTAKAEAFAGRLSEAGLGSMDLLSVYIGDRLGLYAQLSEIEPVTPTEFAERAGIHSRYAREWLEQQAVTGILDVDDPSKGEEAHYPERSKARTVLTLGIIGLVIPLVAPFAWIYGAKELRAQRNERRDPRNFGAAQAGMVMGIIATVLWPVLLFAFGIGNAI